MSSLVSSLERARDLALRPHGWQCTTLTIPGEVSHSEHGDGTARNFQNILDKICEWFVSWQPWQQRQLLCGITNRCATSQLEYLATTLEPVLHRDFITTLKRRYPTAPFKEMKRRLEAKARAKAMKNFEASLRPRSTLSMKSEGPPEATNLDDGKQRDRSVSLANNVFCSYPELLIEKKEADDIDALLKFAQDLCDVICIDTFQKFGRKSSHKTDKVLSAEENAVFVPDVNVFGNIDLNKQNLPGEQSEKNEQKIETFLQDKPVETFDTNENHPDTPNVDVVGNMVLLGTIDQKIKVTFSEDQQEMVFGEVDPSHLANYSSTDVRPEEASTKSPFPGTRKASVNIPTQQSSKLLQTRWKKQSKPPLVISKPLVQQSLPNSLAKHHVTVRKRVELLKSYPASLRASSVAHNHRHYSARDDKDIKNAQFFPKGGSDKLDVMQMELRTGLVNRPAGLADIYIPIQRMYKNTKWWNQPPHPGMKYARPNLTDLSSQYKAQIKQIWEWITSWLDHEKLAVLVNVIKLCDSEQISYLTQCLADRLQARLDIGWLPDHILLKVFSDLTPDDLESCSKVCKRWKYLTSTDDLWMIKCHELGQQEGIPDITKIVRVSRQAKQSIDWRAAYEELKLITQDARTSLPIPQDATESVTGTSSFQDDKSSASHLGGRASVLSQGQNKDDGLLKVPASTSRRSSSYQGSVVSSSEVPPTSESRVKLGTLTKYLHKLRVLAEVVKEKEEEVASNEEKTETGTTFNSDEAGALDSFERLRTELLEGLPPRPVKSDEAREPKREDTGHTVQVRSTAQTTVTMDFSKFGRSTLDSRVDKMKRLRKKNADGEEEEAVDVRPQLLQARDLKTITNISNEPRKMFIIPNKDARVRLEKQAAYVKSVKRVRKLQAHMDSVLCLQMDSRRLISGSMDRSIRIWDIRSGRSVHKLYGHKGGVCCLAFDNEILVSGSWDSSVQVWDLVQFERKAMLLGHSSTVSSVKKGTDFVVSSSHDGMIRVWCLSTFTCLHIHRVTKLHILCMAFDGQHVITGSSDKSMKLVDLVTGECLKVYSGHSDPVQRILLSGNLILTGTMRGHIYFWSKDTGKLESVIQAHEGPILSISVFNGHFYTSSGDMTIKQWDLATMTCVRILEGHKRPVNDFKISERYMVSCSTDGLIRVWDMTLPTQQYGQVVEKIPLRVANKHTNNYSKEKSGV